MTTEDLIARLRDTTALSDPLLTHEAADALEALGREIERLSEVNADQYGALDLASRECTALRAELAAIRAQEPVAVVESDAPGGIAYTPAGLELVDGQELYASPAAKDAGLVADDRITECAKRLVEHADFQLGGILSADSKAKDTPSKAVSQVKSRHLAALRDALAASPKIGGV